MKTGYNKLWSALILFMGMAFIASPANALGTLIATALAFEGMTFTVVALAINIGVSLIIAKNAMSGLDNNLSGASQNPGNRQSISPATNNKLPVIYGSAWTGGTIVDMNISTDNQWMNYVIALGEVTDNGSDVYTFGDIYFGGRLVNFATSKSAAVTIFIPTSTITWTAHGLNNGDQVRFTTTGQLPTGITINTYYYVKSHTTNTFTISKTKSGSQISFTGTQSGTATCYYANDYKVASLTDPSSLVVDTSVNGNLFIYTYSNGVNSCTNSLYSAVAIMNGNGSTTIPMTYRWIDQTMTNCAFAIVQIKYSQKANLTGFQQMKFQVNNPRATPGDCFLDYLTNSVYGAGLNVDQIDTNSLTQLSAYCAEPFYYFNTLGYQVSQDRFQFNGLVDTNRNIMDNLQEMATSCDCLIKYNEVTGLWGVIVQKPTYTVAMSIDDSTLIGSITVSPLDISNSYNVIETKFPDVSNQDSFNSVTYDLAQLAPQLLYPNEPINKQSVTLSLVNNNLTAQYIANRLLESGREDLNITCKIDYTGLQLEAGDIVTVTNSNYGWTSKLFRIVKVTEQFGSDGTITADLMLTEFNPAVFDDKSITEFAPSVNTGLPSALTFGELDAPLITQQTPTAPTPFLYVNITAPTNGVTQYAEIYYSASSTGSNAIFVGTTEIKPSGNGYTAGEVIPPVLVTGLAAGVWYFFYRVVNGLGSSGLSSPSTAVTWQPMTFQFQQTATLESANYLMLAYATDSTGTTGFSFNPRNKTYFGVYATNAITSSSNPADYTWYAAVPNFSTTQYLLYANWGNKTFSFATGTAGYPYGSGSGQGSFVSTRVAYDGSIWSAVVDPVSTEQTYIDLNLSTGQNIVTGTTTNNAATGMVSVQPTSDGKLQVALSKFLNFGQSGGTDILQKTVQPAYLTIDVYGRVVGFEYPDDFYMTIQNYTATSGQTVFTTTRNATYKINNCLVFQNGVLVDTSEYTDTAGATGTVTFSSGRTLNDRITIVSFRSYHLASAGSFVIGTDYTIISLGTTTNAQWNTIAGTSGITYAVGSTFTCANTGAGLGTGTASTIYNSFTRFTQAVTNQTTITPSSPITDGFEFLLFNGIAMNDDDYNISVSGDIVALPSAMTGTMTVIQWSANNLTTPNGNPNPVQGSTVAGQTSYDLGLMQYGFNLYQNGVMQINGSTTPSAFTPNDYTTYSGGYTLAATPSTNSDYLLQQSFNRTGAA